MIEFDVLWLRDGHPALPGLASAPRSSIAHDWDDAASRPPLTLDDALDAFTRPPLDGSRSTATSSWSAARRSSSRRSRERGLIERAMVSTMYTESLAAIRAIEPALRLGWTYPLVTTRLGPQPCSPARSSSPRWPRCAPASRPELRRRAPEIGAAAIWLYHPLATPELVDADPRLGHRADLLDGRRRRPGRGAARDGRRRDRLERPAPARRSARAVAA